MNPIRALRMETGLSQQKFADILHVHQTAVSQWEMGRTHPDIETAKRMSSMFNVSLDYLLQNELPAKKDASLDLEEGEEDVVIFFRSGDKPIRKKMTKEELEAFRKMAESLGEDVDLRL